MPALPAHVTQLPGSGIRAVMERAWRLPGPVLDLHVGESCLAAPSHVAEAVTQALAVGRTHYAPTGGLPDLLDALVAKLVADNGVPVTGDQIVVTAGGTQAVHLALSAVLTAGDEVLVPDPGWPNYTMAVRALQGHSVPYPLHPDDGFRPDPGMLARLVTPHTRAVIINSPANPLGSVLTAADVAAVVEVARRHDLWVISDECYESLVLDGRHLSPVSLDPERVLACYSFSKTYAMTGLRVGYLMAPAQAALLRDAGVRHHVPHGAFYLWFAVPTRQSDGLLPADDRAWAEWLLHKHSATVELR